MPFEKELRELARRRARVLEMGGAEKIKKATSKITVSLDIITLF